MTNQARRTVLQVPKPAAVKSPATGKFEPGKGDKLLEAHRAQVKRDAETNKR